MPMTSRRVDEFMLGLLRHLDQVGTATRQELLDHLEETLQPTEAEREMDTARPRWQTAILWRSSGMVKAGWIRKDGRGVWSITNEGRDALVHHPDPDSLGQREHELYREWEAANKPAQRRAWLIRGTSVLGSNLVPDWLTDGFVSLAASQLRPIGEAIGLEDLRAAASEDYGHLKHHELKAKVDEIVNFVNRMRPGDLVLTTNESAAYVGDVAGDWTFQLSEGGKSNLRRAIEWRNVDNPVDFADLPAPLPARLQSGHTVVDLTGDIAAIESLLALGVPEDDPALSEQQPFHDRLPDPSGAVADQLFVDRAWLQEVRDLLDERRQVIFYGPPGTGKTFIARALAADLVGPEQVKLVQFHPAYTYEDFFEGYRPTPTGDDGRIGFELKPGPLRQLVNRAREHRDQAFVLIIDEINRANLAKVFGELYFLLEYRDQAVDLLYSADDEGFTLPKNLYMIGTMNTADRSIALVDAAMRRRFAFLPLDPAVDPTKSLLRRWSRHHGLGDTAADLMDALNRQIDDPDFKIGPSYFMTSSSPDAHSPARLERIWRTAILPLLEEHHYGQWEAVARRYDLEVLLRRAPAVAVTDNTTQDPSAVALAEGEDLGEP